MEQKKLTRDQAIIKLLRESEAKDLRIRSLETELEKEKKSTERRLKRLEEDYRRLSRLLAETERKTKVLKEKSTTLEHEVSGVRNVLRRSIK